MIRKKLISALRPLRSIGVLALALAASGVHADPPAQVSQSTPQEETLSYENCSMIVTALTASRYDREEGPIWEFLEAVNHDLERAVRGPLGRAGAGCPDGFRAGDSNGTPACFALGSSFGRYPNVRFELVDLPEVARLADGGVEACVTVNFLIYSYAYGDQSRVLCARGRRVDGELVVDKAGNDILPREQYLAKSVLDACGPAPEEPKCK
jgi:hypothetical protein